MRKHISLEESRKFLQQSDSIKNDPYELKININALYNQHTTSDLNLIYDNQVLLIELLKDVDDHSMKYKSLIEKAEISKKFFFLTNDIRWLNKGISALEIALKNTNPYSDEKIYVKSFLSENHLLKYKSIKNLEERIESLDNAEKYRMDNTTTLKSKIDSQNNIISYNKQNGVSNTDNDKKLKKYQDQYFHNINHLADAIFKKFKQMKRRPEVAYDSNLTPHENRKNKIKDIRNLYNMLGSACGFYMLCQEMEIYEKREDITKKSVNSFLGQIYLERSARTEKLGKSVETSIVFLNKSIKHYKLSLEYNNGDPKFEMNATLSLGNIYYKLPKIEKDSKYKNLAKTEFQKYVDHYKNKDRHEPTFNYVNNKLRVLQEHY